MPLYPDDIREKQGVVRQFCPAKPWVIESKNDNNFL
jgi:hypothetical protein